MSHDVLRDDRSLNGKRHELVLSAADNLVEARMIDHAKESGSFTITDLGRIAAKYYISHKSIMIFNRELGAHMTEERVLAMVSLSTEVSDLYQTLRLYINGHYNDLQFDQIQVRDNETKELASLLDLAPYEVEVSRKITRVLGLISFCTECTRKQIGQGPYKRRGWREFSEQVRKIRQRTRTVVYPTGQSQHITPRLYFSDSCGGLCPGIGYAFRRTKRRAHCSCSS